MKVSVMMITYNHERFIAQALESILKQCVDFDYEIVVGEDCSTDSTRKILMEFQRRYPNRIVPLLHNQNVGMFRNLEQTLGACRGQYVAFIEGDDYWTCRDKLRMQVDFLDNHPLYSICCHRAQMQDEINGGKADVFPSIPAGTYTLEDLLPGNFIVTCSAMYRGGTIGSLPRWLSEMAMADWTLHVLEARTGKIELMDEVMAVYRLHSGGVWSSRPELSRLYESTRMLRALDRHLDFQYHQAIRQSLAQCHFGMARIARNSCERWETGKQLLKYIQIGGWQIRTNRLSVIGFANYVLLGSWSGMKITRNLIRLFFRTLGYRLVRMNRVLDNPVPASPVYGLNLFLSLLKRLDFSPKNIIDIGANKGGWTRSVLPFFPDASYILVEPQDHLKPYLQDLIDAGYKIKWINAGAGDHTGTLPFNLATRDDSGTFLSLPGNAISPQITVEVKTINEIVAGSGAPIPDIVKIDAEGMDLRVLAGASDLFGKTEIFFVEVAVCSPFYTNTISKVVKWMDDVGYRVVDITDINRTTKDGALWLCELAFLRNGSHLLDSVTSYE